MASLSLLFNHFLTYPKHSHAHTHRSAYINIAWCNLHVYTFWRTHTHTHAEPKKGKKQRYQWCDTILRMPGQNWSVAHAFDVNPEHGHVTNADTKLHPVLLWSLKPHACFYRGNKIVCVCMCVWIRERVRESLLWDLCTSSSAQSVLQMQKGACISVYLHAWVQMFYSTCCVCVAELFVLFVNWRAALQRWAVGN